MKNKNNTLIGLALLAASLSPLSAQSVSWGTGSSTNPLSYTSNGNVDSSLIWQLGYFTDGFTPTQTNYSQWASNWNSVGQGSQVNYGDATDPIWSVSVQTSPTPLEIAGKQEYVFAYNDLNLLGTPSGEALLYRQDGLAFPGQATQNTFDIANNPADNGGPFNDDAFTVIWGRVDRNVYEAGGIQTGGGVFSVLKPDSISPPVNYGNGTFEAQSGTWIVPEPASALLGVLGSLLLLKRRRSN